MAKQIEERQHMCYEGKEDTPLIIYPEGTVTTGKYIISFKRGAFMSLLPIKPMVEMIHQDEEFTLSTGILPLHWHIIMESCYLYHYITFIDLPVIEPNEYMFENFKDFGKEKWEVYSQVCRHIMSECSG